MAAVTRRVDRFQDWINLVLAAFLFISPWIFQFADNMTASWNAWVCGVIIAALALSAIAWFAEWEEWINIALGVWLVIAPWVLGFSAVPSAMWTHVILGLVIAAFAAWSAWSAHYGGTQATA
jgi:SPW repeat